MISLNLLGGSLEHSLFLLLIMAQRWNGCGVELGDGKGEELRGNGQSDLMRCCP